MKTSPSQAVFKPKALSTDPIRKRDRPVGRGHPFAVFGANGNPQVFVTHEVLAKLRERCKCSKPDETIGLLAGSISDDAEGSYTVVRDIEEAVDDEKKGSPGFVEITASGAASVRARLLQRTPAHRIVGWWHSHPTFTANYSSEDFREQATFGEAQVGIVVSGLNRPEDELFGVYVGPTGERQERLRSLDGAVGEITLFQPVGYGIQTGPKSAPQSTRPVITPGVVSTPPSQRTSAIASGKTRRRRLRPEIITSIKRVTLITSVAITALLVFAIGYSVAKRTEPDIELTSDAPFLRVPVRARQVAEVLTQESTIQTVTSAAPRPKTEISQPKPDETPFHQSISHAQRKAHPTSRVKHKVATHRKRKSKDHKRQSKTRSGEGHIQKASTRASTKEELLKKSAKSTADKKVVEATSTKAPEKTKKDQKDGQKPPDKAIEKKQ